MTLKSFDVGVKPFVDVTYPYLWKDILLEQGKLSWDSKIYNGEVKWPQKKLLEKYMDKDFIYRKKSTFKPPLSNWIKQKDVYSLFQDALSSSNTYISNIIDVKSAKKLIAEIPKFRGTIPYNILLFLWGALFIELWLRENYKPLTLREV